GRESLEAAIYFGADAVYAAGKTYGLRAFADNFSLDEMKYAADYVHSHGRRLYITLNAIFHECDFDGLEEYIEGLRDAKVDAFIISDPGVLRIAKNVAPDVPVHISTQANTTNWRSAAFWHDMGAERVILSRELSLYEIAGIRKNTPEALELEAFVHGAMCISYSGRCLLSNFFTGRGGNQGACAQPCRWEYHVSEQGYPGEYFPVYADDRGTYIFNSKDLNMLPHLGDIISTGVTSLKIEGRMKSAYYVGCVVNAYRRALDDIKAGKAFDKTLLDEVNKAGSRAFTTGFYYGNPREQGQDTERNVPQRLYDFVGIVRGGKDAQGRILIEQRGKFLAGDELDVLSPHISGTFTVDSIFTETGERRQSAPHAQEALYISCPYDLSPGDMLRKKRDTF
ncbi:MAG: U32 family peptidase, partial [Eubacteriales bacterium]|nr:U32 family peptidase [Eubacteriales bacterium]